MRLVGRVVGSARLSAAFSAVLLSLLLLGVDSGPAAADGGSDGPDHPGRSGKADRSHGGSSGSVGIRLLEAPVNRIDDPRARTYIVDHVKPGTKFSRRLEVVSSSPEPLRVQLYAGAAKIRNGAFTFAPGRTQNELSSWVTLDRSALRLGPHERATTTATMATPRTASKGERYAVIWAEVAAPKKPGQNIMVVNRVGIRAYLDVGPGGEPPSDFEISRVRPQRTAANRLKVVANVRNTGERALDIDGRLRLTDGPGSLAAGPYRVSRGQTLAPGDRGEVEVLLDKDLPNGPWKFRLELHSGQIERSVTGTLTFPDERASWGLPASLDPSRLPIVLAFAGTVFLALLVLLGVRLRRRRPGTPIE